MASIQIRCPSCKQVGYINLEIDKLPRNEKGVTSIDIHEKVICNHSFIAYIDGNNEVRDCFIVDFKLKLPEIKTYEELLHIDMPELKDLDILLISSNFLAINLAYLLKCCFHKKKVVFLNDNAILAKHLNNFVQFIFKNSFKPELLIIERWKYGKEKKSMKDCIVLENETIIRDKSNFLNPKNIEVETAIVHSFLNAEKDRIAALIKIKNEIFKAFKLSGEIMEYIENQEKNKKILPSYIIDYLKKRHKIKISEIYLRFLVKIIQNYFQFNVCNKISFFEAIEWMWYLY
ncbi:MAG: hypothetical protein JW891_05195 [Candidatus Lokiarchaeota archaeon]|nr:hypothetical protein [Candidatus Lokiarchaeota archaeon]